MKEWVNYGSWAKFNLPNVLVTKALLKHSIPICLCIAYDCFSPDNNRVEELWQIPYGP